MADRPQSAAARRASRGELADLLKGLGTRQRLAILEALGASTRTAEELAEALGGRSYGASVEESLRGLRALGLVAPNDGAPAVWALTDEPKDPRCGRAVWMALRGLL